MNLPNFRTFTLTLLLLTGAATPHTHAMGALSNLTRKACFAVMAHSARLRNPAMMMRWGIACLGDMCVATGLTSSKTNRHDQRPIETNSITTKLHNPWLMTGLGLSTIPRIGMIRKAGLPGLAFAGLTLPTNYTAYKGITTLLNKNTHK